MRFLAIGAHPDDIDAMIGGTLIRLAKQGHHVSYLICTDGSKGTQHQDEVARMQATRQTEQRAACQVVGAEGVYFLNYVDGELEAGLPLRRDIVRVIRTVKPDVVVAWDPTAFWIGDTVVNHTDHRTSGKEAMDAAYPGAGHATMFPELGLPASPTRELWLYGSNFPNVFVDIENEFTQKKAAVQSHVSQHYLDEDYLFQLLRDDNRWVVRDFDNPVTEKHRQHPEFVESFRRITLNRMPEVMDEITPMWELHRGEGAKS